MCVCAQCGITSVCEPCAECLCAEVKCLLGRDGCPDGKRCDSAEENELQDGGSAAAAGLRQLERAGARQQGSAGTPQQPELAGARRPPRPEPRRPEPVRVRSGALRHVAGQHPQLLELQHRLPQRHPQHQPEQPPRLQRRARRRGPAQQDEPVHPGPQPEHIGQGLSSYVPAIWKYHLN